MIKPPWFIPRGFLATIAYQAKMMKYPSSLAFNFEMLAKTGVIAVPGNSFGERGVGFVRLAIVQPEEKIQKAIWAIQVSGMITNLNNFRLRRSPIRNQKGRIPDKKNKISPYSIILVLILIRILSKVKKKVIFITRRKKWHGCCLLRF
jgi:hypothetical protein